MNIEYHDFIIVGAGPAGLQAGYHLEKSKQDYLILEEADMPGDFFNHYPRHRQLISINKIFTGSEDQEVNLRWDWNSILSDSNEPHLYKQYTQKYFPSAEEMPRYLSDYAEKFCLNVRTSSKVKDIRKDDCFQLTLESGDLLSAKVLIVATGLSKAWLPLSIPGIEIVKTYCDMEVNGEIYNNKRVLVLGKGNSAFETADALIEHASMIHLSSPSPLKMAWTTHYVGHLRAINNGILDTYQLKSQNAILDADIQKIEKVGEVFRVSYGYQHAESEQEVIEYDHVIACTGFRFDASLFHESCRPELCDMNKLPVQKNSWESVNIPDLFFAGTLMQYLDYKKYMSGFIHGFRYNVRTLCGLLMERYSDSSYPSRFVHMEAGALTREIIERVNKTSALWQQPGFLADILVLDRSNENVEWFEELSVGYAKERWPHADSEYFIVTMEFGDKKFDNPFNVHRIARDNVVKAEDSNFLHPIIRHYRGDKKVAEHHVIEDLAAEWLEPEHIEPLREFLKERLTLPVDVYTKKEIMGHKSVSQNTNKENYSENF